MLVFDEEFVSIRRNLETAKIFLEPLSPAHAHIELALVELEICQMREEEMTLRGINRMSPALLRERIARLTQRLNEVELLNVIAKPQERK